MIQHKYFLEVAYRGTSFHGWQIQENANSIQAVLQNALSTLIRIPIDIIGCGRTDTGVHAMQHYSHFVVDELSNVEFDESFIHHMNSILPGDIVVKRIVPVSLKAHARFDAISRTYEYRLYFKKNPFLKGLATFCPYWPNIKAMQEASQIFPQYTDFSCFSKSNTQVKTNLCKIIYSQWQWDEKNEILIFEISADRFLRNMVRAIVGTLLEIGWGTISLLDLRNILESKNRNKAGASVSPDGLYLKKVEYPYPLDSPWKYQPKLKPNGNIKNKRESI